MNNPPMPIKLAMAQAIARKIVENPGEFPELSADVLGRLKMFISGHWISSWRQSNWNEWQTSYFWRPVEEYLPEIVEKLGCTENE